MSSTFDDTVLDFDLNLLNHTTTNTNTETETQTRVEKLRRSVIYLKKKVLFSHNAVSRYKSARKYAGILESNQIFNKEGCKQHLIEIRSLIEEVARLESEYRAAENREKEKNETINDLKNKLEGLQSHEKQLTLLLKEKEKQESVRTEKNKANYKERTRKGYLEKENEALNKEIDKLKKEIETLRKANNKIQNSEKENEIHHQENVKISSLEKEIQILLKEVDDAKNLKKVNECLRKENARIPSLERVSANLRKENARISNLEKENKLLRTESNKIINLEKEIETLRKENEKNVSLENVNRTLLKENGKIQNLEKEVKILMESLALAKKETAKFRLKCHQLLRKYESQAYVNSDWGDNSDAENYIFGNSLSPTAIDRVIKKSQDTARDMVPLDLDNDNSNEVVSIDTGRGSSLAYSDNEKCLHSPDSFENDSILNEDNIVNTPNSETVSINKSPIIFKQTAETEPTAVVYTENEDLSNNESFAIREIEPKLQRTTAESVSPTKETREVTVRRVSVADNTTPKQVQVVQEKECLELNNSISLRCESHTDSEIENILSTVQLNYNAVSPIPRTPTILCALESVELSEETNTLKRLASKIEILGEELINLKKEFNAEIVGRHLRLRKKISLEYNNEPSLDQFDSDHHHNIIRNDRNQIITPENIVRSQSLLTDDPIVNPHDLNLTSNVIRSGDNNNVSLLSKRLSTELGILQNNQVGNNPPQISLPKRQDENHNQLQNQHDQDCRLPQKLSSDKEISKDMVTDEETNLSPTKAATSAVPPNAKSRKITKLDKLKKKLEPKYKIRRETPPLRSRKIKPKQLTDIQKEPKRHSLDATSVSLNDKQVYEKAVKVMAEINSQQINNLVKSPSEHTQDQQSPKPIVNLEKRKSSIDFNQISQNEPITTRSKRKIAEKLDNASVVSSKEPLAKLTACQTKTPVIPEYKPDDEIQSDEQSSRKRRRNSSSKPEIQCKRILRSSTAHLRLSTEDNTKTSDTSIQNNRKSVGCKNTSEIIIPDMQSPVVSVSTQENSLQCQQLNQDHSSLIEYDDLNIFSEDIQVPNPVKETNNSSSSHPKESILCRMIEKYGVETFRSAPKKVPDVTVKFVCEKLEQEIAKITEMPMHETKNAMNQLVTDLRKLNYKHFMAGLMKYLIKPERKIELFGKVNSPPAPPMTKAEQILLYVISHLKTHWPSVDIVDTVLSNIEYTLFKLNRTPEFDVIETTSHFYAVLCRYFKAKSRLRLFILDAMYCIQFKSVPLIKQCLDVWMHIIPLSHMGIAKTPLVTCLVYLLHFYKCDDKFNRVQEIRNILHQRYFYKITDWNEKKILELFKISIMELKDIPVESKMLRLALILLAKRQGPRWCQNNIIKNLLQPIIDKEGVPSNVKEFCLSVIGPLMRPYPVDMKVHCEIAINQLNDILNNDPSPKIEEAVITSMLYINRHDQFRVNQTLLSRRMKPMSPELEKLIREYVKTKPLKMWKKTLSKMTRV